MGSEDLDRAIRNAHMRSVEVVQSPETIRAQVIAEVVAWLRGEASQDLVTNLTAAMSNGATRATMNKCADLFERGEPWK